MASLADAAGGCEGRGDRGGGGTPGGIKEAGLGR